MNGKQPPMMKCGHRAHGVTREGPMCVVCYGMDKRALEVETDLPSLHGRKAQCNQCGHERESSHDLAMFSHAPLLDVDFYYCGCRGWS